MTRRFRPIERNDRSNETADTRHDLGWLHTKPSLDEMRVRFPDDFLFVQREIEAALVAKSTSRLDRLILLSDAGKTERRRRGKSDAERGDENLRRLVRRRLALLFLERHAVVTATSVEAQGRPQGRLSRALTSGLFFDKEGAKKLVSSRVFGWTWPLVQSKAFFLASMQAKGTYCFLSYELVDAIAHIVGSRSCVEVAAGDGTLSRFLGAKGISVIATDDRSWSGPIQYPSDVLEMSAAQALEKLMPKVVLCSWPPPGNHFEKAVFATASVQTYLVIGSRLDFATGARSDYESQTTFSMTRRPDLEALVLPPEIGTEVLLFERIRDDRCTGPSCES